jgi:anti-sigma factor RsiW
MNCRLIQRSISEYLDSELTGEQMFEVRNHLRTCDSCRQEVESLKMIKSSLQRIKCAEPSADFEQRLFECVEKVSGMSPKKSYRPIVALGMAASVGLLAAALYFAQGQTINDNGMIVRKGQPVAETVSVQDFESDQSAFASSDPFGGFAAPINVRNDQP